MVRQFHDGMMARVTDNGNVSEAFAVTNGVKQGCDLALTLFNRMFPAMLMGAYQDERPGIRVAYRTDSQLFNQQRMNLRSRVSATSVHELLFADDCALNDTSERDTQRSMDLFAAACDNFSLVMHQPPPDAAYVTPKINVNGAQLQVVDNFTYDFPGQPGLRSSAKHSLKSAQSPHQHQTEDVQGGHPVDAAARSGNLEGVQEAGTKIQPLPPQLSLTDIEAEVAGPDPGDGRNETDGILIIYAMLSQLQLR
ncbi:hypothetical protein SprV_0501822300 [Sparganum proliferum]